MFNLGLDADYKQDKFFNNLLEKGFKFILSKKSNAVTFHLCFILLLVKINPIVEEQSRKKNVFKIRGISRIKIILVLPIKIVALYI